MGSTKPPDKKFSFFTEMVTSLSASVLVFDFAFLQAVKDISSRPTTMLLN